MAEIRNTRRPGRKAIQMEFIKDPKKRHVSFSKRKLGLFKKSAALCSLFSPTAQVAAFVFSPKGKLFCFAHPHPDTVINRFLNGGDSHSVHHHHGFWWDQINVDDLSLDQLQQFRASLQEVRNRAFLALNNFDHGNDKHSCDYDGINLMDNGRVDQLISIDDYNLSEIDFLGFVDFEKKIWE